MKHSKVTFCFVVTAAIVIPSVCFAGDNGALVNEISGKVLLNQGNGYFPAAKNSVLNLGDKLLVGKDARAVVTIKDCQVSIVSPMLYTIPASAPCVNGAKTAQVGIDNQIVPVADAPIGAGAAGAGAAGAGAAGAGAAGAGAASAGAAGLGGVGLGAAALGVAAIGGAAFMALHKNCNGVSAC